MGFWEKTIFFSVLWNWNKWTYPLIKTFCSRFSIENQFFIEPDKNIFSHFRQIEQSSHAIHLRSIGFEKTKDVVEYFCEIIYVVLVGTLLTWNNFCVRKLNHSYYSVANIREIVCVYLHNPRYLRINLFFEKCNTWLKTFASEALFLSLSIIYFLNNDDN